MDGMIVAFCYIVAIILTIVAITMIIIVIKLNGISKQMVYQSTLLEQIESNTFKSYMSDRIEMKIKNGVDLEATCRKYIKSIQEEVVSSDDN